MTAHTVTAEAVTLGYDGPAIVHGVDLALAPGRVTVIVGANASGKSTLLRGLARLLKPRSGVVTLDGTDVQHLAPRAVSQVLGLLPQQPIAPDGIVVAELVGRGRYPHQGWFRRWTHDDEQIVARAMEETDVLDLAERDIDELSGGQRQRVWIALALAQNPDILLLDEPTTFLDISHQIEVLELVARLNRERGTTVAMVLHDLNLAARYADELVVMAEGRIVAQGAPLEVLTPELLREAFHLDARVIPDPASGTPLVIPEWRGSGIGVEQKLG